MLWCRSTEYSISTGKTMLIHHHIARTNHCIKRKTVRWRFCQRIQFSKANSTRTQKSEKDKKISKSSEHMNGSWQKAKESTSQGMTISPLLWLFKIFDLQASVITPQVFFHSRRTACSRLYSRLYKTRRISPHLSTHVSKPSTTVGSSPCRANAGLRNLATNAHNL